MAGGLLNDTLVFKLSRFLLPAPVVLFSLIDLLTV